MPLRMLALLSAAAGTIKDAVEAAHGLTMILLLSGKLASEE